MTVLKSAAKTVFILLALTACVAFLLGILKEENFMVLTSAAFSFYFSHKGDPSKKYLGK